MLDYLKQRFSERSTRYGLAVIVAYGLSLAFPQYADTIAHVFAALGFGSMITPDKST